MTKPTDLVSDWMSFYSDIGVHSDILTGNHVDCPLCNEPKGFRTNIKTKPGAYVCKHCTESRYRTALDFVMRFLGLDTYLAASDFIRKQCGNRVVLPKRTSVVATTSQSITEAEFENEVRKRQWIWDKFAQAVTEGDPVWKYLTRRIPGLTKIPSNIRYQPNAQYWEKIDGKMQMTGEHPAMLVRGMDAQGRCVQLHTTYLTFDGQKANVEHPKKTKTSIGSCSFCLRLTPMGEDGVLGLTEGIENGVKAEMIFGHPVWPCHSNTVLANFEIPEIYLATITKLIIYADNDGWRQRPGGGVWNPGITKARELADRMRKVRLPSGRYLKVLISYTGKKGDLVDHNF